MPTKRATYHHRDLGNALVAAAGKLVATHGVAGFSLREAARAVGVDPAACYRHFRDKEALLDELARRGFTRLAGIMEDALSRDRDPLARIHALGLAYVRFALDEPAMFRTMFASSGVDARDPRRRGDYVRGPYEILEATTKEWLATRQTGARPTEIGHIARVLWCGVHGVAALAIDGAIPLRPTPSRLAGTMIDALLRGMPAETTRSAAPAQ